jgi:hypothetical protein
LQIWIHSILKSMSFARWNSRYPIRSQENN